MISHPFSYLTEQYFPNELWKDLSSCSILWLLWGDNEICDFVYRNLWNESGGLKANQETEHLV